MGKSEHSSIRKSKVTLLQGMKRIANLLLAPTGCEIRRIPSCERNKYAWLQRMDIATIVDIGANSGQFALEISSWLPRARIYSFEPIADVYQELCRNVKHMPTITTFNCALGSEKKRAELHRNEFSPASSLLDLTEYATKTYPFVAVTAAETVTVERLDDIVARKQVLLEANLLLKIDVQGYELEVIKGACDTLRIASVVIIEASFKQLYSGQPLFTDIMDLLRAEGFKLIGIYDVDCSELDGIPIYGDAIFFKQ